MEGILQSIAAHVPVLVVFSLLQVVAQEKPDAPQRPSSLTPSQNYIELTWAHPKNNTGRLLLYEVQFNEQSSNAWNSQQASADLSRAYQVFKVVGLLPWREYKFKVRVKNAAGWSEFSPETDYQRMLPIVPLAPDAPEPVEIMPTRIALTWTFSKWTLDQGDVREFELRYREANHSESETLSTTSRQQTTVANLRKGTKYFFSVKASNGFLFGAFSEEAAITTDITIPGLFKNVTAVVLSHEKVHVAWSDLSDDGGSPITKVHVAWREISGNAFPHWEKPHTQPKATDSHFVVSGLHKETDYQFRVSVFNRVGKGHPASYTDRVTTMEFQYPPDINNMSISDVLPDRINLTLYMVMTGVVVPLTAFEITLRESEGLSVTRQLNATSHTLLENNQMMAMHTLTSLKPATKYSLTAVARNEYAASRSPYQTSFSTNEGLPPNPSRLSVDSISHNSVWLSWLLEEESKWPLDALEVQIYNFNEQLVKTVKTQYAPSVAVGDLHQSAQYKARVFIWSPYGRSKLFSEVVFKTRVAPFTTPTPKPTTVRTEQSSSNELDDQTRLIIIISAGVGGPILLIVVAVIIFKACQQRKARAKIEDARTKAEESANAYYDTYSMSNATNRLGAPEVPEGYVVNTSSDLWGSSPNASSANVLSNSTPQHGAGLAFAERSLAGHMDLNDGKTEIPATFASFGTDQQPSTTRTPVPVNPIRPIYANAH